MLIVRKITFLYILDFFDLNLTNFNSINLNHSKSLSEITEKKSENKFLAKLKNEDDNSFSTKPIFFKLSPLLDPIKFLIGKYHNQDSLLGLPKLHSSDCHNKYLDTNNASYVDGFFTYLTSMLLHKHNFTHGVDFYGSYLAIKNDYKFNIFDDIEYLQDSKYFKANNGKEVDNITFSLDNEYISDFISNGSNSNREKLTLNDNADDCTLTLSDIKDLNVLDSIFKSKDDCSGNLNLMYEDNNLTNNSKKSNSTCSSRSSDTGSESSRESDTDEEEDSECDNSDCEDSDVGSSENSEGSDENSSSGSECSEDEELFINITKFPIQIIALEQCERTLDSLLNNESLNDDELESLVMQIVMTLLTYQKVFDLTHNDLHTNNIMYVNTSDKYLYYKINNKKLSSSNIRSYLQNY